MIRRAVVPLLLACATAGPASAQSRPPLAGPPAVAAVDVDENLGARIPLDLTFTGSDRRPTILRALLDGQRPVVLVLAYYHCPMLCDLVLRGISSSLHQLGWQPGHDYRGLTVSIDPHDTPGVAHLKQAAVLQAIGQTGPSAEQSWPFLVGAPPAIHALADAVGFRYAFDPQSRQFAHPAVVMILTPDGRISRYLYGVNFRLLDLRLALTEAAGGNVGTGRIVERVLLTCFHYDPSTRRYGFYVSAVLKGGASCALLAVGAFLAVLWRRDARRTGARRA